MPRAAFLSGLRFSLPVALFCTCTSMAMAQGAPVVIKQGPTVVRPEAKPKPKPEAQEIEGDKPDGTLQRTKDGLPDAAASPLRDLNLRKPIPPDFLEKLGYAYTITPGLNCTDIAYQVADLDEALQDQDYDIIAAGEILDNGDEKSETVLDVIGSITSAIIPLRPIVRTATGARRAKKHYEERFDNGRRRRAFLKGYGLAKGCNAPAAPLVTYAPDWGKDLKQPKVDPNTPNRRLKDSYVPPGGN